MLVIRSQAERVHSVLMAPVGMGAGLPVVADAVPVRDQMSADVVAGAGGHGSAF